MPSLGEQGGLAANGGLYRLVGRLLEQEQRVPGKERSLLSQEGVEYSNICLQGLLVHFGR